MTLNEIADELIEVRRYVRSDIEYVRRHWQADLWPKIVQSPEVQLLNEALFHGVHAGVRCIQVDPTYLENALYNTAADLRRIARKQDPKEAAK